MSPEQLGPYRLTGQLGRGGMGIVYSAVDVNTSEPAAVKVLTAIFGQEDGFRERFQAEIESLIKLSHPNIVRILGYGEESGYQFYAMELVSGRSLDEAIKLGRRYDWREAVQIVIQVCRALKHAHDRGIIHRDLKPANLLQADAGLVKLSDFGIAKLFGSASVTTDGGVVGTAEYMAPEQADGHNVSYRSDLYSLGGVLYALLARRPPLRGKTLLETLDMQRHVVPEPIRNYVPDAPIELEEIIAQLLAKQPEQRVPTAQVLLRRLEGVISAYPSAEMLSAETRPLPAGEAPPAAVPSAAAQSAEAPHADASPTKSGAGPAPTRIVTPQILSPDSPTAKGGHPARTESGSKLPPTATAPPPAARPPNAGESLGFALAPDVAVQVGVAGLGQGVSKSVDLDSPVSSGSATVTSAGAAAAAEAESPFTVEPVRRFVTVDEQERRKFEPVVEEDQALVSIQTWALAASLLALGLAVWWYLQPPSADRLYASIDAAAKSERADQLLEAQSAISAFLRYYPDDPRANEVQAHEQQMELHRLERRFDLRARRQSDDKPLEPVERAYLDAMQLAPGNPDAAIVKLAALSELYRGPAAESNAARQCLQLADRQLRRLRAQVARFAEADRAFIEKQLAHGAELAAQDAPAARVVYQSIVALYGDKSWTKDLAAQAAERLKELPGE
jgi:serine/threonine protein kinase